MTAFPATSPAAEDGTGDVDAATEGALVEVVGDIDVGEVWPPDVDPKQAVRAKITVQLRAVAPVIRPSDTAVLPPPSVPQSGASRMQRCKRSTR
jgi:hypothetical protein